MQIAREFRHLDELRLLRNYAAGELRQQLDDEIETLARSLPVHHNAARRRLPHLASAQPQIIEEH